MLVYNFEFILIRTMQNQFIVWTRLSPRRKYTHPIDRGYIFFFDERSNFISLIGHHR